jgi:hypothetical protein
VKIRGQGGGGSSRGYAEKEEGGRRGCEVGQRRGLTHYGRDGFGLLQ